MTCISTLVKHSSVMPYVMVYARSTGVTSGACHVVNMLIPHNTVVCFLKRSTFMDYGLTQSDSYLLGGPMLSNVIIKY